MDRLFTAAGKICCLAATVEACGGGAMAWVAGSTTVCAQRMRSPEDTRL